MLKLFWALSWWLKNKKTRISSPEILVREDSFLCHLLHELAAPAAAAVVNTLYNRIIMVHIQPYKVKTSIEGQANVVVVWHFITGSS